MCMGAATAVVSEWGISPLIKEIEASESLPTRRFVSSKRVARSLLRENMGTEMYLKYM